MKRVTVPTLRVLAWFLAHPTDDVYGLELIRLLGVPSGSLYSVLRRLEAEGWLVGQWESLECLDEGRRPRRFYRLTPLGDVEGRMLFERLGVAGV